MLQEQSIMRQRILYIMNVDWDWAKQRPHFIAHHLSSSHEVTILYPYSWRRNHLVKNDREGLKLLPFFYIPFGGSYSFVGKINIFLMRLLSIAFLKFNSPDIVWISSPELFEYLPKHLSARLIYDCMDDTLAFPRNFSRRDSLAASEKELITECSHVFCSSKNLRDKLIERVGCPEKYSIVYNAFEPSAFVEVSEKCDVNKKKLRYVLGYVGTVSSWLDFKALIKIVNTFPNVEVQLIGPIENLGRQFPRHERIKYLGAVKHGDIQKYMSEFDALLMPFLVTDLIQSVDPVKLYEYIFFNKPIVSVGYAEIERFSDFVDFYIDHDGLMAILSGFLADGFKNKYSEDGRCRFIVSNTWSNRVNSINVKLTSRSTLVDNKI